MAKCDEGYLCSVCGEDVAEITDSDLYLRYVIGMIDPELLHATPERHIRCNPLLAQFIVDDGFEPVVVDGEFSKAMLDPEYVNCLLYTSPSPRDRTRSRMPSSA